MAPKALAKKWSVDPSDKVKVNIPSTGTPGQHIGLLLAKIREGTGNEQVARNPEFYI
jgi:hypothetical protein